MNVRAPKPKRGDVLSVDYADPDKVSQAADAAASLDSVDRLLKAPKPDADERVAVRLAGYPYLFIVRVVGGRAGPVIRHLEITAVGDHAVDYDALRSVPLRRIALSAWNWLQRFGGVVGFPGDHHLKTVRPEDADADRLVELVQRVELAIRSGEPVRKTVAAEMHVGTATVDRMIRRAKDAGLLDGIEIPKRPGPRQRDDTGAIVETGNER